MSALKQYEDARKLCHVKEDVRGMLQGMVHPQDCIDGEARARNGNQSRKITIDITTTIYNRECSFTMFILNVHNHFHHRNRIVHPHYSIFSLNRTSNVTTPNSTKYGTIHEHPHSVPMAQLAYQGINAKNVVIADHPKFVGNACQVRIQHSDDTLLLPNNLYYNWLHYPTCLSLLITL